MFVSLSQWISSDYIDYWNECFDIEYWNECYFFAYYFSYMLIVPVLGSKGL